MSNNAVQNHLVDCDTLSATELRKRYRAEANTHRNMLQRAPSGGKIIHPDFRMFRNFLTHVGPRLCHKATLDRVDNSDPEYGPGKVRWADKRTQNSNKGDTLVFHHSLTKDAYTTSRLAKLRNVKPNTIRKRKDRGWTDDEIIEGKRQNARADEAVATSKSQSARPSPRYITRASDNGYRISIAKDPAQRRWEQAAEDARYSREVEGVEYCLADLELINEVAASVGMSVTREQHFRHFARWWPRWKPHVIVANLEKWAQEYVARIDAEEARTRSGSTSMANTWEAVPSTPPAGNRST